MDVLRAYILVQIARVERERLQLVIERLKGNTRMGSKLDAVATAMDKMNHGLEARADKLLTRIEQVDQRADGAFGKAHKHLDEKDAGIGAVEQKIADLEKATNNGPLPDSPAPSPPNVMGVTSLPLAEKKT